MHNILLDLHSFCGNHVLLRPQSKTAIDPSRLNIDFFLYFFVEKEKRPSVLCIKFYELYRFVRTNALFDVLNCLYAELERAFLVSLFLSVVGYRFLCATADSFLLQEH